MLSERNEAILRGLARLFAMKGEYVWGVTLSMDNVLWMHFGSPYLRIRHPYPPSPDTSPRGRESAGNRDVTPTGWRHLFISDGEWAVMTRHHSCTRADMDKDRIRSALLALDGQKLVTVCFLEGSSTWRFDFDLGGSLTIWPSAEDDAPDWLGESQWVLFAEDDDTHFYTNAGELKRE